MLVESCYSVIIYWMAMATPRKTLKSKWWKVVMTFCMGSHCPVISVSGIAHYLKPIIIMHFEDKNWETDHYFFTILTQILCIKVVEYDSVIVLEILYIYSSPSKGCHGPRSAWGGEIGGTGVDSFGSPGTALVRSQTQVPASGNSKNSSNPCTEQLRSVESRILCEILMLTKLLSTWINVRQLLHFTVQMLVPVKWIDSRIQSSGKDCIKVEGDNEIFHNIVNYAFIHWQFKEKTEYQDIYDDQAFQVGWRM